MTDDAAVLRPVSEAGVRVDRWLWAARMFKTRSRASKACAAGHVKCNSTAVKAARAVHVGDEIDVLTPGGRRLIEVAALADKRGSASAAVTLYHDYTPEPVAEAPGAPRCPVGRPRGAGRPTKRERRALIRFRDR